MASQIMFLDCPAYLNGEGSVRCGLPAELKFRFITNSSDGPLESAMIRCPSGHFFNGPIEFLTYDKHKSGASAKISLSLPADRGGICRGRAR